MAVYGVIGNIGSGKTLFLTAMAYEEWKIKTNIYANYNLRFEFEKFCLNKEIQRENDNDNFFVLDELWLSMDSRESNKDSNKIFTKALLQSRKWGGKSIRNDVLYSTQSFSQIDVRTRRITSLLFAPTTLYDDYGKPFALKVYYNKWVTDIPFFPHRNWFIVELWDDDIYIPDLFDTSEILESMDTGESEIRDRYIDKYVGWTGKKKDLTTCLLYEDKLDKGVASYVADVVFYKKHLEESSL